MFIISDTYTFISLYIFHLKIRYVHIDMWCLYTPVGPITVLLAAIQYPSLSRYTESRISWPPGCWEPTCLVMAKEL